MGSARSSAEIDPTGVYRYSLTRRWADVGPLCCWIMLNPSTADADADDPTIRRCVGFAKRWGWSGIHVVNLFALRAADPRQLLTHPDPVGPENDDALRRVMTFAPAAIAAWGATGGLRSRGDIVRALAADCEHVLYHLGLTKGGQPKHPLYLPGSTVPKAWEAARPVAQEVERG